MKVHLVDGTYELFRYYFALPSHETADGREVGAIRGVVGSMLTLLEDATHVGIATDHVIVSFRNDLYDGYKDGSDVEPGILQQFHPLEDALRAFGFVVWPMVRHEADDAMGAGAAMAGLDPRVSQVVICTPDKDLAQCVVGERIVQWDRRKDVVYDENGVFEKFGVEPASIPDYLALVGDAADGFPGLKGWGAKSTSTVLARYKHLENIPPAPGQWDITVRSSAKLAATLADNVDLANLFRRIATIDTDAPVSSSVDELEWVGPTDGVEAFAESIDAPGLAKRARYIARQR
ncbi:MAG: 5'-3' exonuclease H3TH domain-containing protein [Acidimicrobiales bacterium]